MKRDRVLSYLIVISMLAGMLTGTIPVEASTSSYYSYTVNPDNKTCIITDYTGPGGNLTIPGYLDGYKVTAIGEQAFLGCWPLTEATIPDGVTSIGQSAFGACSSLNSITIPDSVTSIGMCAFRGCEALTGVTLPYSVTSVGTGAFQFCSSLGSVIIPNNGVSIGNYAFEGCYALTSVTIPSSVTSIGDYAFGECSALTSVYFDGNLPKKEISWFDDTPLERYYCHYIDWINLYIPILYPLIPVIPLTNSVIASSSITNGTITPSIDRGIPGETISFRITPAAGYRLKPGSLKYNDGSRDYSINGIGFTMPDKNITISGVFEKYAAPTVRLSSPSGTSASVSIPDIVLSFNETVTSAVNKKVTIFDCKNIYTYTIGASDNYISGAGSACKATIPVSKFTNGTDSLSLEYSTAYVVSIEAGTYIGSSSGKEATAGNKGCFMTELDPFSPPGNKPVDPAAAAKVEADKAVLDIGFADGDNISAVTQNLELTVTGAVYGSSIAWESSDMKVISNSGIVTPPAFSGGDADITVTASIYNSGVSDTKSFELKVLKLESPVYIVIFRNWDGTMLKVETVNGGGSATAPANPSREGYSFTGWDKVYNSIISDLTLTAQYSKNSSSHDDGNDNKSNGRSSTKATAAITKTQVNEVISKALQEAVKQGNHMPAIAEIKVEVPTDTKIVGINLDKAALDTAAGSNISALAILTPIVTITIDDKALDTISKEAEADVKITASKVDNAALGEELRQLVGDRPVFDFTVTSGGRAISQFGGNVSVSVPYTPGAGEDTNAIVIYCLNTEGKLEIVSNCAYDSVTGRITFTTSHFSLYAVGYNKVSFKDVAADEWYGKAVDFIAARGITAGTGNGCYSPEAKLTRAEFLVMIMKTYGIEPDENRKDNFIDAGNTYYTGYLAAAKHLGISGGIGNNMFAPDKEISRQEIFALLYNILKSVNALPEGTSGKPLSAFSDTEQIAAWAKDAMELFAETGIIEGSKGKLTPENVITRAEMAQVLLALLDK